MHQHKVISRAVIARTKDDAAVLQDLPQGQRQYAHSFPLIPTFDALSYFRLEYNGGRRDALSYVHQVQPLTFTDPRTTSHADVVVVSLRYYHASYLPDSNDRVLHIAMEPLATLTTNNSSDFYLHDLSIDASTMLPTHVTYTGPDTNFSVDYAMVQNHWLVNHVAYDKTMYAPLKIGRLHFSVDASYTDFAFPTTPGDPRLE